MGLKKLFGKGIVFCGIILSICVGVIFLSTQDPYRQRIAEWTDSQDFMDDNEVLPGFDGARKQDQTRQLLIGDSICGQMFYEFQEYNQHISMQASNAPFMITGQYILAEEYLKYHPEATDIFLVMHPVPLTRTFDTQWSYRYGVMTYAEVDAMERLDENTRDAMVSVYGKVFIKKEIVQLIEDSPILRKLYLNYVNFNRESYAQSSFFEIADQYVKKLYELCEQNGVTLHLYPAPVTEFFREHVSALAQEYDKTWMSKKFPDYFNDILYYPNEWSKDMSHFGGKYEEPEMLKETIERAYEDTALLESLRFGIEP